MFRANRGTYPKNYPSRVAELPGKQLAPPRDADYDYNVSV